MDGRQLDFNAPLLSVRRISAASAFSRRDKQKIIKNSPPTEQYTPPLSNSDVSLDLVRGPVAVPFIWEQIPGKAKSGIGSEFQLNKEGFGKVLGKHPVEKDFENPNPVRPQTETDSENDDDAYSDALETLSPTGSFSMNCSVSGVSGPDGPVAKPSGTFSTDPQTLDFMMTRFLPAAKAMTLAPQCPKEVKKEVVRDRKPLDNKYESNIIPCYNEDDDEETEDECDDYKDSSNISRKACGLLPRLCSKNSMCLLDPVPGLKVRTRSSMSSTHEVAKPGKACMKSNRQIVETYICDVVHKNKSCCGVRSPGLPENKSDSAVLRLLEDKSDNGVQSPRLSEIRKKMTCGSNHFTSSNDHRSPPERLPGGARISPYRRERPQSPFRGGGFLGLPKEAEKFKANMPYATSNNNSQELVPYPSTRQGSVSLSPAVEKTLYVDAVNFTENACSNSMGNHSDKDPVYVSFEPVKGRACGNLTHSDDDDSRVDDQVEAMSGSGYSHLPPPLPKTASLSWLKRALPSVTPRNSFLQSHRTHFNHEKQEPKIPATDAKWETIVKTSRLHHDHVRYSEELVTHFSQH